MDIKAGITKKKVKLGLVNNLGLGQSRKIKPGVWVIVILLCLT